MRPTRWRTSTHLIVGVGVLAIVAALVAAAALLTSSGRGASAHIPPAPPAVTATPGVVPVAANAPMPSQSALAAALALAAADPNLGKLGARVTDALTGEELWQQFDDVLMQPASTNKTLTTAAALLALDRDARVTTRVVAANEPGTVVLVGGGDPTLSGAAPGQGTWYHHAPRLSEHLRARFGSVRGVTRLGRAHAGKKEKETSPNVTRRRRHARAPTVTLCGWRASSFQVPTLAVLSVHYSNRTLIVALVHAARVVRAPWLLRPVTP